MLNRLFSTIKRGSRKIGQGGYTLIEVAAVVAITATLAAVVVPIAVDKVKEGKAVAAKQECQALAAAIGGFYKDTGFYPAYNGDAAPNAASLVYFNVLRSGNESGAVGVGHDPIGSALKWLNAGNVDLLENHLVKDNPNNVSNGYRVAKYDWKGPYSESLASKRDPWGNNYLVYVGAMHGGISGTTSGTTGGTTGSLKEYGWIISAGPNGILETGVKDKDLVNDDIGVMLFASETPKG